MLIKSKGNKDKKTWMHPSRKKILDVMHGRESGTATVGWDKVKEKKEVGDRWFDANGKEWEQHEGFKSAVTQYDEAREYFPVVQAPVTDERPKMAQKYPAAPPPTMTICLFSMRILFWKWGV
jgi:hypothetical protein